MMAPQSFAWLARHELRLSWRDWTWMMSGGYVGRIWMVIAGLFVLALFLHWLAFVMVLPYAHLGADPDRETLLIVTGGGLLTWTLMLSQSMELVTRAFYGRGDLDLLLSSPISPKRIFAVRAAAIAFSTVITAGLLAGPFINVLILAGGLRWLCAYALLIAAGFVATAIAILLTATLFQLIGPRRTRIVAQVVAAIIGSAFVIGVQGLAVVYYGTLSRFAFFESDMALDMAPAIDSSWWLPARAILGDWKSLIVVFAASSLMLAFVVALVSGKFADFNVLAQGISRSARRLHIRSEFRVLSAMAQLRRKEWTLLLRDPWLISQTLMQILYLIPPALLLWRSYGAGIGNNVVLAPVLVMSAGQLAGGLAWLAVSGEDAPDLLASAPVPQALVIRAKIEAVLYGIAMVFAPLVLGLAFVSPGDAAFVAIGIAFSSASAAIIQLWFRSQAKRSHFRRRQTSSRVATFAEAFSSIAWAGAAGLATAKTWMAVIPMALAFCVLGGARALAPRKE